MFGKVDRRSQDSRERPDRPQKKRSSSKQFAGMKQMGQSSKALCEENNRREASNRPTRDDKCSVGVVKEELRGCWKHCGGFTTHRTVWRKLEHSWWRVFDENTWTELEKLYCSSQELHDTWRKHQPTRPLFDSHRMRLLHNTAAVTEKIVFSDQFDQYWTFSF